jgi:putative glutamine amidotransferase
MTRLPTVGVTTSLAAGRYMWWFYLVALRLAGIRPVRLTVRTDAKIVEKLDGLVIGGGDDIGAEIYGGMPTPDIRIDPARDRLELDALEQASGRDIPVLGICRGAQMLNVFEGGTLHRDIYEVYKNAPRVRSPLPRKQVTLESGSTVSRIMGLESFRANSMHHQSIDRVGSGLSISGRDQYGIVQAIESNDLRFRLGVQWHPEFMIYRSAQRRLFKAFANAVCERV